MAQAAPNYEERQEFWKPVVSPQSDALQASAAEHACPHCGTEFIVGSRFCHICGANRSVNLADTTASGLRAWFDYASLRDALGQSTGSLAAFIIGFACVIAAAVTGLLFTATTLLDWQAVQIWRIEWLLAGVAAFVAGLLLKKKTT
jgi:predicted RNA-binding Zn-ribbon protein involved in translation (DUF1610 family)